MIQLYIYIPLHILFHFVLSQGIEYSSLCNAVGPCWLCILYLIVCIYSSQTLNPFVLHSPFPWSPWQLQVCSLCLCISLYFILFYFIIFYLFLGVSGLSCSTRDLLLGRTGSLLWCTGFSLVVAGGFSLL